MHSAQTKVQTGFLPGTRGGGFQLRGVKPLSGMLPPLPHPCQCQLGSGRKWEPGGPGIPSTQLRLDGAPGDLTSTKPAGPLRLHLLPLGSTVPFLCPGRLLLAPWILLPQAATRWRAGASQRGPERSSSPQSAPQGRPLHSLGTGGSHHNFCFATALPAADPNWDRLGKPQTRAKSNQSVSCPKLERDKMTTGQDHSPLVSAAGLSMAQGHRATLPASPQPFPFLQSPPLPFPDTS